MRISVAASPNLQRILFNAGWLVGDKAVRIALGLVVGIWVARYLGTEQFGLLSYATAFTSLFGAIGSLGISGIAVRDLVREPHEAGVTLGTAFFLRAVGGVLAFALSVIGIGFARPDDGLATLIVVILGFALILKASEVVKYWFESQVQSKYVVWAESACFIVLSLVKVSLIIVGASLVAFAWAVLAEAALVAAVLLCVGSWRGVHPGSWRVRWWRARVLLKEGWPLILSAFAVMIYMRIDQIMLGTMLGDQAVGIYAAAVHISEAWYFLPAAIAASVFPAVLEAQRQDADHYHQRLQRLYNLMVRLAVVVAIPMTFLSTWIVTFAFGSAYSEAGVVLAIHIWAGVFVSMGVASGKALLAENLQLLAFYRTAAGAIMNIAVNLAVIPTFGAIGAAAGTVLSQAMAGYAFDSLHPATRNMFMMKTRALVGLFRFGARR